MPATTKKAAKTWPQIRTLTLKDGSVAHQVDTRLQGKGKRYSFTTKAEAQTFAEQMRIKRRNEGVSAFSLSPNDRIDAEAALAVLRGHGITLKAAADFSLRHLSVVTSNVLLADFASEMTERKRQDGVSKYFLSGTCNTWKRFAKAHDGLKTLDVTTPLVDQWLRGLEGITGDTRNGYRKDLVILFKYAVAHKHMIDNAAKAVAHAKSERGMPKILEIPQLIALLRVAHHEIMPAILLGAFAGLRPFSEGCRLQWEHIDFETRKIDIAPGNTKNRSSIRYVSMADNLIEWLLLFRQRSGPVAPSEEMYDLRRHEAAEKAGIDPWPQDGLRHTFASMHHATHKNTGLTTDEMGHRGSQMLFRHYRQRVTEAQAAAYWEIRPMTLETPTFRPEMRLGELLEEIQANQNGGSPDAFSAAVMYNIKFVGQRFAKAYPHLKVSEVEFLDTDGWLNAQTENESSRKTYRYALSCMFRFAIRRGYCARNPTDYDQAGPQFGISTAGQNNVVSMTSVA